MNWKKKAFQMLDVGQTLTVSKGEFRSVETFLFCVAEAKCGAVLAGPHGVIAADNCLQAVPVYVKSKTSRTHEYTVIPKVEQPQLPNNDIKSAGIATQGESMLTRLCSAYQDIEKAFREIDVSQSGFVSLDYLKSVINGFIFLLPKEIFQELMNSLKATGKIAWQQFEKLQDPGSTFGKQTISLRKSKHKMNEKPCEISLRKCWAWRLCSSKVQGAVGMTLADSVGMITDAELACDHAHYYLVIKARTRWYDLVRNFQEFDSEENGIIQPRDLKKFSFPFGIPITLLGISIHDSKLSCFDFLRAIEDGRASEYQQKQKQAAPPASFAELSVQQTLIKETVTSSDLLYKFCPVVFMMLSVNASHFHPSLLAHKVLDHEPIQSQMLHCWTPMKKTFKFSTDITEGKSPLNILEYYDRTSKISYNYFLWAFVQ
ncbi:LOW QUALITY PROTEIN: EF-hand calcium-binding domain-containing protein 6 [Ammospiza maritima maritima]